MEDKLPISFDASLKNHLADNAQRVSCFSVEGQTFWVKRKEALSLRFRLQKGNAKRSLEREREALRVFEKEGLPTPRIVAEGDDYFVVRDVGKNIMHFLARHEEDAELRKQVFTAAGKALSDFHLKGHCHGRPAIRDFCWDGTKIALIDFEHFDPSRNGAKARRNDLLVFAHSALTANRGDFPELAAALGVYRQADTLGVWDDAVRFCRRMRWVDWVTKPMQWRGEGRAKEFKAIPMVFDIFGAG